MNLARAVDLRPQDLTGRTWAGYIRESTRGQADRYGPELQREEQRRFAERYGLVATGHEYLDLVSGKDTLRRTDFGRMLADAEAGGFAVLLVYDTSRFARNVADAWTYRERLARLGIVVVFVADGLIAGNTDTYELEGLKTVSDAAYIRRLSRNVSRGLAQKWRLYADPGGRPPLGFVRSGERRLLEPLEGPDLETVRRAFALYATGTWSDTGIADELALAEAGVTEILTNPLYAGRVIRHKGRPDAEEQPARFPAPVDPALFDRVQQMRDQRRTAHPAGGGPRRQRRPYPLIRLMRCTRCGSPYHGDANNGRRRVRHSRRPACWPSATYAAEPYEEQIAELFEGLTFDEADVAQVLAAMRRTRPAPPTPDPAGLEVARADLQARLSRGEIGIEAFSRAWRRLDRPVAGSQVTYLPPDEARLRRARTLLGDFATLWRDPAVPDRLREEALHEIVARVDVAGPEVVAVHPQPNENAWLLGQAAMCWKHVGMVGARGLTPPVPTSASR